MLFFPPKKSLGFSCAKDKSVSLSAGGVCWAFIAQRVLKAHANRLFGFSLVVGALISDVLSAHVRCFNQRGWLS